MVLAFMLAVSVVGADRPAKERVIFDSDSAFFNDDGAALAMLLCHPKAVDVVGVTLVSGNVWLEQGAAYTLHLLDMLERSDIPVLLGEALPTQTRKRGRLNTQCPEKHVGNRRAEYLVRS
ncbi:MAG: nucleoside hydrolase [Myxococcota bacterium]